MSTFEQSKLAEKLRLYFLNFPGLPVKEGAFLLDVLGEKKPSMSLQMNPGQQVRRSINGRKTMRQPFTIFYRSSKTGINEEVSSMLGILNSIGEWLEAQKVLPYFGTSIKATKLEQVDLASIVEQENTIIAYMATFALEYDVKAN